MAAWMRRDASPVTSCTMCRIARIGLVAVGVALFAGWVIG